MTTGRYAQIGDSKGVLKLDEIPVLGFEEFMATVDHLISGGSHCVNYFAVPGEDSFRLFCILANDEEHVVRIFSQNCRKALHSVTEKHNQFHVFEREIREKHGIDFIGHPWMKPLRCLSLSKAFYQIHGEELHEVGVGPVHAGVIEPGHFRFICNGEKVLHLEIQLGYQHRGVEDLMLKKDALLERMVLCESIAGDTVAGHAITHATLMETLGIIQVQDSLVLERMIALEMERMAVHIGDVAALCTDTAYQFGQVVCEALRTIVINTTQLWCGNRFSKGLIRTGGTRYPLSESVVAAIRKNLTEAVERFEQAAYKIFSVPSVLNRFEGTGVVTKEQATLIGAVGMAARSSGLKRDVRWAFPSSVIPERPFEPVVFDHGDVYARGMVRREEVRRSYQMIMEMLDLREKEYAASSLPVQEMALQPGSLAFAMTEGWRGEICHAAVTNEKGRIITYKVKDPSMHNWMALALAVRNQGISDFPLCNKSFNLSYCGHDL